MVQATREPLSATQFRQPRTLSGLPRWSGRSWRGTNGCGHWHRCAARPAVYLQGQACSERHVDHHGQPPLKAFCERHGLSMFSLACIRPGVLSCFYRVRGDLRRTRAVANHVRLATTVRYVETPQVQAKHRARIAELQSAFIDHVGGVHGPRSEPITNLRPARTFATPSGEVVSMFGFDCYDPFAGSRPARSEASCARTSWARSLAPTRSSVGSGNGGPAASGTRSPAGGG